MNAPHHPAYVQGYHDAQRGHTACPYGLPSQCEKWREGYDFAEENGEAELPRFGKLKRRRI
jgi:ribosome modulation factor